MNNKGADQTVHLLFDVYMQQNQVNIKSASILMTCLSIYFKVGIPELDSGLHTQQDQSGITLVFTL